MSIANQVLTRTEMVPMLDEIYKLGSKSSILDASPELVNLRAGKFELPTMELDGLADHSRANGGEYVGGNVGIKWETYAPTYERNRRFQVDVMDNYETADIAFSRLAGEFIRLMVIPEIDAYRFASYFKQALAENIVTETILTGEDLTKSVVETITKLEENEVPQEDTFLFVTPTVLNQAMLLKTIESVQMLSWFGDRIVKVPQNRLKTDITLLDGKTAGQEKGGWKPATDAKDINYGVIHRGAVIQGLKHEAPKYTPAAINQLADGDAFAYRVYGVEFVRKQKLNGIYFSVKGE